MRMLLLQVFFLCAATAFAQQTLMGSDQPIKDTTWKTVASCQGIRYETLPGFFIQDAVPVDGSLMLQLPPSFGLIDQSPGRWDNLTGYVEDLNRSASWNQSYKVIFLGRHGEGYHNVAEAYYGTDAWDAYWSLLNGDGNMTWGPDAKLTNLGVSQAQRVHYEWLKELPASIPLPTRLFTSPLSRAARTLEITFSGLVDFRKTHPLVVENLREKIGLHTCDKRSPKSVIHRSFRDFQIEEGFTEEDQLWRADYRETEQEKDVRVRSVLDRIFSQVNETYIAIVAHGGVIESTLRILNHVPYSLGTGGVIPMLVKATFVGDKCSL